MLASNLGQNSMGRSTPEDMLLDNARLNQITGTILGGAIEVHRVIGPGLLESPYMPCLESEHTERGLSFVAQAPIALSYKTLQLDAVCKVDLLVEDLVIVEVKCVEAVAPVHKAQLLTYLRLVKNLPDFSSISTLRGLWMERNGC